MEKFRDCALPSSALVGDRIVHLTSTFLYLLDQLENNKLFICEPALAQHRIEYLGQVIRKTLEHDRQVLIRNLQLEIGLLKAEKKQGCSTCHSISQDSQRCTIRSKNGSSYLWKTNSVASALSKEGRMLDEQSEIKDARLSSISSIQMPVYKNKARQTHCINSPLKLSDNQESYLSSNQEQSSQFFPSKARLASQPQPWLQRRQQIRNKQIQQPLQDESLNEYDSPFKFKYLKIKSRL